MNREIPAESARNGEIPKFQKPLFGTTPPSALSGLVVQTFPSLLAWNTGRRSSRVVRRKSVLGRNRSAAQRGRLFKGHDGLRAASDVRADQTGAHAWMGANRG
ncbi:hypothetical protein XANMN_09550 [Xanthomonas phaseoli pv. manihotis str. CIO151]|nr:hypothetical protein XANMN_09550 [Xanthomonas phaseoli pv. manihotis str. CIO151]